MYHDIHRNSPHLKKVQSIFYTDWQLLGIILSVGKQWSWNDPHSPSISKGTIPIELFSCWLIWVCVFRLPKLGEHCDDTAPITSEPVLKILFRKPCKLKNNHSPLLSTLLLMHRDLKYRHAWSSVELSFSMVCAISLFNIFLFVSI